LISAGETLTNTKHENGTWFLMLMKILYLHGNIWKWINWFWKYIYTASQAFFSLIM